MCRVVEVIINFSYQYYLLCFSNVCFCLVKEVLKILCGGPSVAWKT